MIPADGSSSATPPERTARPRIAIVGGGFTGAAVVVHLAAQGRIAADVDLIEPAAEPGRGLAYSATDPLHRINVPSARMSLFPGDADHATRWFFARGILPGDGSATDKAGHHYVARSHYGAYVTASLDEAAASARPRLSVRHVRTEAQSVTCNGGGWSVQLRGEPPITADVVILCIGHAPASLPCPVSAAAAAHPGFLPDPWQTGRLAGIDPSAPVLLVGTGLTMADVAASLLARGHRGLITAVSRRGLLALPHGRFIDDFDLGAAPHQPGVLDLLRLVRRGARLARSQGLGWQPAADALRYRLPKLWPVLTDADKRAVVARLLPFWEVHRFRVAPMVHAVVEEARRDGRLSVERAALVGLDAADGALTATLRRSGGGIATRAFGGVVLCVGPERQPLRRPLLAALAKAGLARLDATGLGPAVDAESRLLDAGGTAGDGLFALGPPTRGTFGEMTGAPDIVRHVEGWVGSVLAPAIERCGAASATAAAPPPDGV